MRGKDQSSLLSMEDVELGCYSQDELNEDCTSYDFYCRHKVSLEEANVETYPQFHRTRCRIILIKCTARRHKQQCNRNWA